MHASAATRMRKMGIINLNLNLNLNLKMAYSFINMIYFEILIHQSNFNHVFRKSWILAFLGNFLALSLSPTPVAASGPKWLRQMAVEMASKCSNFRSISKKLG